MRKWQLLLFRWSLRLGEHTHRGYDVRSGRDLEQTWPTSGEFLVWPAHAISVWIPVTSEDQVSSWVRSGELAGCDDPRRTTPDRSPIRLRARGVRGLEGIGRGTQSTGLHRSHPPGEGLRP